MKRTYSYIHTVHGSHKTLIDNCKVVFVNCSLAIDTLAANNKMFDNYNNCSFTNPQMGSSTL